MIPNDRTFTICLIYCGTLPLISAATSAVVGYTAWIEPEHAAVTYSAIILSFLAGIHWAMFLLLPDRAPRYLLLTSNIIALIAWLSLYSDQHLALYVAMLGFLIMLALDGMLAKIKILPGWFFALRRNATLIVCICLGLVGLYA